MLRIKNLVVYHGYVQAIKDLSLEVKAGELLVILGANGAGKSTLLGTVAGLYKPVAGEILLKGSPITGQKTDQVVKQGISLVPEKREILVL